MESYLVNRTCWSGKGKAQDVGGRNVDIPHSLCPLGNQSAFREQLSRLGPWECRHHGGTFQSLDSCLPLNKTPSKHDT